MKTMIAFVCLLWVGRVNFIHAQSSAEGRPGSVLPTVMLKKVNMLSLPHLSAIGFFRNILNQQSDKCAFIMEVIPFVIDKGAGRLLLHPGLGWVTKKKTKLTARAAFEVAGVWGFTPALAKGFKLGKQNI